MLSLENTSTWPEIILCNRFGDICYGCSKTSLSRPCMSIACRFSICYKRAIEPSGGLQCAATRWPAIFNNKFLYLYGIRVKSTGCRRAWSRPAWVVLTYHVLQPFISGPVDVSRRARAQTAKCVINLMAALKLSCPPSSAAAIPATPSGLIT